MPDFFGVAWLPFTFLELERRRNLDVDLSLTECFEFTT